MQEKWIGDQHLVTILHQRYGLTFTNKRYINRYLPSMYFNKYNRYHVRVNALKRNEKKLRMLSSITFSKSSIPPRHLSTNFQWQEINTNFKILRCNHPRTPLKEISQYKGKKEEENQDLPLKRKSILTKSKIILITRRLYINLIQEVTSLLKTVYQGESIYLMKF